MNAARIFFLSLLCTFAAAAQVTTAGPANATLVLEARGEGVQIYVCTNDKDWAWKLKAPEATLFDAKHHAIGKHFA